MIIVDDDGRWREEQIKVRATHVCDMLRVRPASEEAFAAQIETTHGWSQPRDIAHKALALFETPARRKWAADFVTVDQVCVTANRAIQNINSYC